MSCTCVNLTNKNKIDRLTVSGTPADVDPSKKYLVYIRGNKYNPIGVVNKLIAYGGKIGNSTTADLMDNHNIFYIDYNNNNEIVFINDSDILSKSVISCWDELTVSSDITYTPADWEGAIIDWPSAARFDQGKDEETNNEIQTIGRLKILRDIYRKGWVPTKDAYYYIATRNGNLDKGKGNSWSRFLSFQTPEIRDTFFDNYKEMIETVKYYI